MRLILLLSLAACSLQTPTEAPLEPTATAQLLGDPVYASDCSTDERVFLDDIMAYGRIAATTTAFESCVEEVVRNGAMGKGPYMACDGDPFASDSVDTQIDRAIQMARTPYDTTMHCTGGNGNASTDLGTWNEDGEEFWWGGWFQSVHAQLSLPVCGTVATGTPCRFAPDPWPWSQASGIAWHEVMHQHGYTHGANDQANAKVECGYPTLSDSQWHFQRNTMPYIVGFCLDRVISESGGTCGDLETCGSHELRLIDDLGSSTCSCEHDPRMTGLGAMNADGGSVDAIEQVSTEEWMGSWNHGSDDHILASGDFDGDGRDEFLIRSGWGLGVIGTNASDRLSLQTSAVTGSRIGTWYLRDNDEIVAVGDFDGDGRDEFVIQSFWGVGVLGLSSSGGLVEDAIHPYGGMLGVYELQDGDVFMVGDLNGDGRDELVVTGAHGDLAALTVRRGSLSALGRWTRGTRVSGWLKGVDELLAVGDLDGDGNDEFVLQSGWGMGIFGIDNRRLTGIAHGYGHASPALWTGRADWVLSADDEALAVADLNGNGTDELLLRSPTGFGALTVQTGVLRTRTSYAHNDMTEGGWRLGIDDTVLAVGDFDGTDGEEFVIQSGWGTAVVGFGSYDYTLLTVDLAPYDGTFGSWLHALGDEVHGAGDLDGDGVDEFLFQRR